MTAHAGTRLATLPPPRLSVVLLAAAVVHVVIGFAVQRMTGGYLDLSPARLVFELRDAMPFVLAAALASGWDRWPAARSWLVAAAVAFALAAALRAAAQLWLGLTWPPEPTPSPSASVNAELLPILAACAMPFGPLLAAIGLWRAWSAGRHGSGRLMVIAAATLVAALAVALRLLLAIGELQITYHFEVFEPFPGAVILANVAFAAGAGTFAFLAVAALWTAPRRYYLPEALIAVGAGAAALSSVIGEGSLILVSQNTIGFGWIAWTGYVELLGLVTVTLGFFSARISVPGEA